MAFSTLLPWLTAAAAIALALVALVRIRAASLEASRREQALSALRGELASAREQLQKAALKQRHSSEELVQARHKLEKTKKRVAKAGPAPAGAAPSHMQSLEQELESARQVRDAAKSEARSLAAEVEQLRAKLRGETKPEPLLDNPAIDALQRRAAVAEAALAPLRKELAAAHKDGDTLREKIRTEKLLYVSMRGELQAKKERLRTQAEQIERLRALKVVVDTDSA
jgi:chromosome segregation ATPase